MRLAAFLVQHAPELFSLHLRRVSTAFPLRSSQPFEEKIVSDARSLVDLEHPENSQQAVMNFVDNLQWYLRDVPGGSSCFTSGAFVIADPGRKLANLLRSAGSYPLPAFMKTHLSYGKAVGSNCSNVAEASFKWQAPVPPGMASPLSWLPGRTTQLFSHQSVDDMENPAPCEVGLKTSAELSCGLNSTAKTMESIKWYEGKKNVDQEGASFVFLKMEEHPSVNITGKKEMMVNWGHARDWMAGKLGDWTDSMIRSGNKQERREDCEVADCAATSEELGDPLLVKWEGQNLEDFEGDCEKGFSEFGMKTHVPCGRTRTHEGEELGQPLPSNARRVGNELRDFLFAENNIIGKKMRVQIHRRAPQSTLGQ